MHELTTHHHREANMDSIEKELAEALDKVRIEQSEVERSTPWTTAIYSEFTRIGRAHGFQVYASNGSTDGPGWLYDVVWVEPADYLKRIGLIAECEWNPDPGEIWHDFQKLFVGRADHRVMIFERPRREDVRAMFKEMESEVRKYEQLQTGDRYVLAGFDFQTKKFRFHDFQV
jgi:hypothetical protein